jgi:hypothetical protein
MVGPDWTSFPARLQREEYYPMSRNTRGYLFILALIVLLALYILFMHISVNFSIHMLPML